MAEFALLGVANVADVSSIIGNNATYQHNHTHIHKLIIGFCKKLTKSLTDEQTLIDTKHYDSFLLKTVHKFMQFAYFVCATKSNDIISRQQ